MIVNPVRFASGAKKYKLTTGLTALIGVIPSEVAAGETVHLKVSGAYLEGTLSYTLDGVFYLQRIYNKGFVGANDINFVMPAADAAIN